MCTEILDELNKRQSVACALRYELRVPEGSKVSSVIVSLSSPPPHHSRPLSTIKAMVVVLLLTATHEKVPVLPWIPQYPGVILQCTHIARNTTVAYSTRTVHQCFSEDGSVVPGKGMNTTSGALYMLAFCKLDHDTQSI